MATDPNDQRYQPFSYTPLAARQQPPANDRDAAVNVIRSKLDALYAEEPDAAKELTEAEVVGTRSKHQEYMHQLVESGKSLADIQTQWHEYYLSLPEEEKHQVWQEFYDSNKLTSKYHVVSQQTGVTVSDDVESAGKPAPKPKAQAKPPKLLAVHPAKPKRKLDAARIKQKLKDARDPQAIKQAVLNTVSANGQLKAKHHVHSLLFGLSVGVVTLVVLLFGLFNEVIIAPFIQPNRNADATPLILSGNGVAPTSQPEVIIPKINVEIPVNYSETSTDEDTIENDLESGIVHYPTTVMPGQNGNAAFFGHSSNNIFNKGKYKFAFVLLHTLVPGDTFYLTNNGKVYVYRVVSKDIVDPSNVGVLGPVPGQTATATLITCDPPGTSLHRLIIVGVQVSPDPASNSQGTTTQPAASSNTASETLPGNGPTLLTRLWHSIF